jgi:phage replication-related protein YjqB (UPF0714/DUF867 family)
MVERVTTLPVRVGGDIHREVCRVPDAVFESTPLVAGQQVRLAPGVNPDACALYTVRRGQGDHARVSSHAHERLGVAGIGVDAADFDAHLSTPVVTDLDPEAAKDTGEFVEGVVDGGTSLVACAPHGGHVEPGTDVQARRVAERAGATAWWCAGFHSDGAFDRWHVTSNDTHPASFPALATLAERGFDRAVSFHGWGHDGVGIGGGASLAVRERVRDAIDAVVDHDIYLVENPDYRGDRPENVVNWLGRLDGIQLEQSIDARREHWDAIADAVADTLAEGER